MRSMKGWASKPIGTGATARRDQPARRRRIGRIAAVAVTAMLASTLVPGAMTPASADVGFTPPLATNGFPAFFEDGNVKLRLCDTVAAGCSVDLAVDHEAFYFGATAATGNLEIYEAALEGIYLNGVVNPADAMGFGRLRFRVNNLLAGQTYKITHPYGVNTFVADTTGRINVTLDTGCADPTPTAPCDWNAVGAGFMGDFTANTTTFLKQVGAVPANTLGDPLVAKPVTGAPSGVNAVVIEGPNAGGVGINTLRVSDFTVEGQIVQAATGTPSMPDLRSAAGIWDMNNVTNAILPTFTGTITGATAPVNVSLTVDGVATAPVLTTGGTYTITLATKLAAGPHTVIAVAGAGLESTPLRFTVDTTTRLSDFNRDNRADMLARDKTGTLWLYPGNGTGGFLGRTSMGAGWNAFTAFLTPGDVNGDGNGDALARDAAGQLWLYPGNGSGLFKGRTSMGLGWNNMTAIAAAGELNGDPFPDVLARDKAGTLWIYPSTGTGAFGARLGGSGGWNAMTAILGGGDLTGDNKGDLLARDKDGTLWLYPGTGTGTFSARTSMGAGWNGMTALAAPGNLESTNGNDLIAQDGAGTLWLYPGNNAGRFSGRRSLGAGFSGYTIA